MPSVIPITRREREERESSRVESIRRFGFSNRSRAPSKTSFPRSNRASFFFNFRGNARKKEGKKKKGRRTNKKLPQSSIREIFTSMRRTVNTLLLRFLEIHHRPEKRNSTTRFFTVYPDPLSLERFVPKTATTLKWCAAEGVVRSGRASLGSHPRA